MTRHGLWLWQAGGPQRAYDSLSADIGVACGAITAAKQASSQGTKFAGR